MGYTGDAKRAYQKAWIAKRRQDWIDSQGGCCAQCGSTDRLEVDHVDPTQKLCQPASIWSRTQKFRDEELAKCQVLCYDHHKEKTIKELSITDHSTQAMYDKGCRCNECRFVAVQRVANWRSKKSQ